MHGRTAQSLASRRRATRPPLPAHTHPRTASSARSVAASVNTKNFLQPADDLSFRVQYSQPYAYGLGDPKRTRLTASLFNGRKICGVFTPGAARGCWWLHGASGRVGAVEWLRRGARAGMCCPSPSIWRRHAAPGCPAASAAGPGGEEVPAVWVDRTGAKAGVTEQYSRNSRGSLALVAQQVTTRDETGAPCSRGMRTTPFGQYVADGPPTCLSGEQMSRCAACGAAGAARLAAQGFPACLPRQPACCPAAPCPALRLIAAPTPPTPPHPNTPLADKGVDVVVSAQGSLMRDTTYLANGAQVGARDIITVSPSRHYRRRRRRLPAAAAAAALPASTAVTCEDTTLSCSRRPQGRCETQL